WKPLAVGVAVAHAHAAPARRINRATDMTGAVRRSNGAGRAGADVQCHKASEHDKGDWLVEAVRGVPYTVCRCFQPRENVDFRGRDRGEVHLSSTSATLNWRISDAIAQ